MLYKVITNCFIKKLHCILIFVSAHVNIDKDNSSGYNENDTIQVVTSAEYSNTTGHG